MSKLLKSTLIILSILFLAGINSCDDEQDCGCDGKVAFNLYDVEGQIYYESDFASFVSNYSQFNLCNQQEFNDTLSKFEQGARVVVNGKAHYECYRSYAYGYQNYMLTLQDIREYKVDD